jgi:ribosomal protein S18 acetylase RimI-like enzyme
LAVDSKFQGQKLGSFLLVDALRRCLDSSTYVGSMAVVVDPIDHQAFKFYSKFGFIRLPGGNRMFLPMATVLALFHK